MQAFFVLAKGSIGVRRKRREEGEEHTSSDEWPAVNSQYNLAAEVSDLRKKHAASGAKQR